MADIVLWAALYPILSLTALEVGERSSQYLLTSLLQSVFCIPKYLSLFGAFFFFPLLSGELCSVRGWFDRVGQLPACKKAVQKILPGKELDALKNFLQKQPAPPTQRRENLATEVHDLPSLGTEKRKSKILK